MEKNTFFNNIAANFENELTKDSQCLIFDDARNRRWIAYGVRSPYIEIDKSAPFNIFQYGQISVEVYNTFFEIQEDSPHVSTRRKKYAKDIGEDAANEAISYCQKLVKDFPADFDILKKTLTSDSKEAEDLIDKIGMDYIWRLFCFAPVNDWLRNILNLESMDPKFLYGLDYDVMIRVFHKKMMVDCGMYEIHFTDGNSSFCRCYSVPSYFYIFYFDFLYALQSIKEKRKNKIVECPRCRCLFFASSNNYKYCPCCSRKEIALENRNKSVRRLHKRIQNKMYGQTGRKKNPLPLDELDSFTRESNYYWSRVQGKSVEHNPEYSDSIKTEEQYKEWLEDKLKSL